MTTEPEIAWEKSDRLLCGGTVVVRGTGVPHDDGVRAAVAVTVRLPAGFVQASQDDEPGVATILLAPGEALGISAWLREAALASDTLGPPLYDWDH